MQKELLEVINYYAIGFEQLDRVAYIVDQRNGERWHFMSGYGNEQRAITQPGCAKVIAWLGESRIYSGSILDALDMAHHAPGLPPAAPRGEG